MNEITGGILTNAKPLSKEQIKQLEDDVLNSNKTYAYLDENNNICFMMPHSIDGIRDLAWNNAYEVQAEEESLTKNVYQKTTIDSYKLEKSFQKEDADSDWIAKNVYSIVTNLSNCFGYSTNPTEIIEGTNVTLRFRTASRHTFPTQIQVTGAEYDWDFNLGELFIYNPTSTVSISVDCERVTEEFVPSVGEKDAP